MRDPGQMVMALVIILGSIALHEFAHAKSADSYGDDTPRMQGRVTLNPLAHLDPIGTVMIFITVISGYGIGWGKPVQVNPRNMQNPRWDHLFSVLWGPLTNVIIAVAVAAIFRLMIGLQGDVPLWFKDFADLAVTLNLGLAAFNMIPIGPLDGHWILGILLPPEVGYRFIRWSQTQGSMFLLLIIVVSQVSSFNLLGEYFSRVIVPVRSYLLGF